MASARSRKIVAMQTTAAMRESTFTATSPKYTGEPNGVTVCGSTP